MSDTVPLLRRLRKTPLRDLLRGRVTGRLDLDRLLDEADLPEPVCAIIRGVIQRTRLWRLEKMAVAQELIDHFKQGLDSDQPAEALVRDFGSPKQAAKLIRRAKKRQRPWAWHALAWARLALIVLAGIYMLSALYLLTGSPSVTIDYLAQMNRKALEVEAGEAAWPLYREAFMRFENENESEQQAYSHLAHQVMPGDPDWPTVRDYLLGHADTLELVREAASRPRAGYIASHRYAPEDIALFGEQIEPDADDLEYSDSFNESVFYILLPQLGQYRRAARILRADVYRAMEAGDADTALRNVIAILDISEHTDEQATLIGGLVRLSLQDIAYVAIWNVLVSDPELWSDEQMRDLGHRIGSIRYPSDYWIEGERIAFYDLLQRAYTDDGNGDGVITMQGMQVFMDAAELMENRYWEYSFERRKSLRAVSLPVYAVTLAGREEMRKTADQILDDFLIEVEKPLWQNKGHSTITAQLEAMEESPVLRRRYAPILAMYPACGAIRYTLEKERGEREGVLIGIALELYRRTHGEWPASLEALTPSLIPELPVDRITGGPLGYRVIDGHPTVYSFGADRDDDGGVMPTVNNPPGPANYEAQPRNIWDDDPPDGDWVLWTTDPVLPPIE